MSVAAPRRIARALDGILAIDKSVGPTSHDVVASLRRIVGMRRIGHCGTLDPLASGVLVTCLGRYTRLSQWISGAEKEYQSPFRLGATSDTGDSQGNLTSKVVDVLLILYDSPPVHAAHSSSSPVGLSTVNSLFLSKLNCESFKESFNLLKTPN